MWLSGVKIKIEPEPKLCKIQLLCNYHSTGFYLFFYVGNKPTFPGFINYVDVTGMNVIGCFVILITLSGMYKNTTVLNSLSK